MIAHSFLALLAVLLVYHIYLSTTHQVDFIGTLATHVGKVLRGDRLGAWLQRSVSPGLLHPSDQGVPLRRTATPDTRLPIAFDRLAPNNDLSQQAPPQQRAPVPPPQQPQPPAFPDFAAADDYTGGEPVSWALT